MKQCHACPDNKSCRVPGDLQRFDAVARRLEMERRQHLLQERLRHYTNHHECLVEAGYVTI